MPNLFGRIVVCRAPWCDCEFPCREFGPPDPPKPQPDPPEWTDREADPDDTPNNQEGSHADAQSDP